MIRVLNVCSKEQVLLFLFFGGSMDWLDAILIDMYIYLFIQLGKREGYCVPCISALRAEASCHELKCIV